MENYDKVLNLQEVSLNSAGSAQQKFTIYQESATAASERLTTAFQKLFMGMDSKGIKGFINLGTGILNVISAMGGLNTILLLTGSILILWKGTAIFSFFMGLPRLIMTAITAIRTFGITAATLQSTLGLIGLVLTAISIGYGLITARTEANNQAMAEGLATYQSQIQALTDLRTKLDETVSGTGTESEKRTVLLALIKGMNSAYETEATNLTTVNGLRDLATEKIDKEAKAAASAFLAKSGNKYNEAKTFIEKPGSVILEKGLLGGIADAMYYTNVTEKIKSLEKVLSELQTKKSNGIKLSKQEEETLRRSQVAYDELSSKMAELLPYYEQGNAAQDVLNGKVIQGVEAIKPLVSENDRLLASIKSASISFDDLAKAIDPLDSALTKLAKKQNLTAREVFALIDQYPELISSLKSGTNGYYLEESAIEAVRIAVINKKQEDLRTAFASADAILASTGIIVNSYVTEISAIAALVSARNELALQFQSEGDWFNGANQINSNSAALKSIAALKEQLALLNTFSSYQDISAARNATAAKEASDAQKAAEDAAAAARKAAEEAQKAAEDRLKAQIDIKMAALDAEKKATEDSFDQQIDALDKVNDARQEEIDLIKAKEALLHAQTQKRMVYREGMGFVAESDTGAIVEAEQTVADLALEKQKKDLESRKTGALASADQKKTEYQNQLLRDMQATSNEGLRSVYASVLGMTELDGHWYDSNGKRAFKEGGINNYTGLAMLHGKPNQNEVIFNSSQASALFNWVQGLANPSMSRTPLMAGASNQAININGSINLPNVKNGMDFITELQLIAKNR